MSHATPSDQSRRQFIQSAGLAAASVGAAAIVQGIASPRANAQVPVVVEKPDAAAKPAVAAGSRPVVISSANGLKALEKAYALLVAGSDPLDAVVAAVNIVEDDPNDHTVGLGGLPNEEGVVELDACVMHGPTHKAGAVAALRNIRNPSCVARLAMQRTDHVLLVGEGALKFARAHGFKEENLLTDEAREIWLRWRASHSKEDAWLTPEETGFATSQPATGSSAGGPRADARQRDDRLNHPLRDAHGEILRTWGTINCTAVTASGDLGGVTTTSGLSYKIPGRVGDSPIIGAGLYVDNAVGAAGSTGRGEANLQNCSSFLIVEMMRGGMDPQAACLAAVKRVADHTEKRLRDGQGRPAFDLKFYALAKDGRHAGASIWSGMQYAVRDAAGGRLVDCAYLYERAKG